MNVLKISLTSNSSAMIKTEQDKKSLNLTKNIKGFIGVYGERKSREKFYNQITKNNIRN